MYDVDPTLIQHLINVFVGYRFSTVMFCGRLWHLLAQCWLNGGPASPASAQPLSSGPLSACYKWFKVWSRWARHIEPMLFECWATVCDAGPTLKQRRVVLAGDCARMYNILLLLCSYWCLEMNWGILLGFFRLCDGRRTDGMDFHRTRYHAITDWHYAIILADFLHIMSLSLGKHVFYGFMSHFQFTQ